VAELVEMANRQFCGATLIEYDVSYAMNLFVARYGDDWNCQLVFQQRVDGDDAFDAAA